MNSKISKMILTIIWTCSFAFGFSIDPAVLEMPNIWTFIPILLLFITVIIIKNYYISFFLSTLLSLVFVSKHFAFFNYVDTLIDVCSDADNIWIIMDIFLIGGLINLIKESRVFDTLLDTLISEKYISKSFIILLSACLSFDDYFLPSMISSVTDRENGDRFTDNDSIAFLCRSATISFANYNPISWPVYTIGLLISFGVTNIEKAYSVYYSISIFVFFPIILVSLILIQSLRSLKKATYKNRLSVFKNKKVFCIMISFFTPLIFHMIFSIIISDTLKSLFLTIILTTTIYVFEKKISILQVPHTIIMGFKNMFEICLIIILSLIFSSSLNNIHFTEHAITLISEIAQPQLLPFFVFLFFSITEYFFSLNWSLWLIIFPVLIEVCISIGANLYLALGAVLSAGILGSISCVYSDASVLSINCFSLDIRSHAKYTLLHILPAAFISAVLYFVLGFLLN